MNSGQTVFSQLINFLPKYEFDKIVKKYKGNYRTRSFSCWDQFLAMSFAQMTYRESLRDIEACLQSCGPSLYHLGFRGHITRTNLANANEKRDWRIYAEFAQILINMARKLYQGENELSSELEKSIYAIDSTTIDLCLSLFPWAKFRRKKSAVKLHTVMDLNGSIPTFIYISCGKVHDVKVLDLITTEPGSIYIFDRGYLDFSRLYIIDDCQSYFIIRAKKNLKFRRLYSASVDKSKGLRCDQIIKLEGYYACRDYPEKLRRVKFKDEKTGKIFVFLTNNFEIKAELIAELYKNRWKIEIFFKWIKQNLRIKKFYGTSANAVKTQIWIAISTYLLAAIMKKELKLPQSLYIILQILSINVFNKMPLNQLFSDFKEQKEIECFDNTLNLFNF